MGPEHLVLCPRHTNPKSPQCIRLVGYPLMLVLPLIQVVPSRLLHSRQSPTFVAPSARKTRVVQDLPLHRLWLAPRSSLWPASSPLSPGTFCRFYPLHER